MKIEIQFTSQQAIEILILLYRNRKGAALRLFFLAAVRMLELGKLKGNNIKLLTQKLSNIIGKQMDIQGGLAIHSLWYA